jgi:glutaredoxin
VDFLRSIFRRSPAGAADPVDVVLYTKPDCPLCEEMKRELGRATTRLAYRLHEVDIRSDPELEERFGRSIPVLEIAGRVAFKGRLTPGEFGRKLERLAGERRRRPSEEGS